MLTSCHTCVFATLSLAGHNDFYPVVIAACQKRGLDGQTAALAMILLDELRGRLAEVFSLKTFRIDHVVHGAIASAAVYGVFGNILVLLLCFTPNFCVTF